LPAVGVAAIVLAACASGSADLAVPALIVAPSAASRAELRAVLAEAVGGPIALADDALTEESTLTIERRTPPGAEGRAASGRSLEAPERFELVIVGSRCTLVRPSDGRRWPLRTAQCRPADSNR
jgi:hypothetical protein